MISELEQQQKSEKIGRVHFKTFVFIATFLPFKDNYWIHSGLIWMETFIKKLVALAIIISDG